MTLCRYNDSAPHSRRGFTLTEIAIVLGIIGLILGAIWSAASAVYNNLRMSRAQQEILTVAQNIRAMYATQSAVDPNADSDTDGNNTYINAGIFPSDATVQVDSKNPNTKVAQNPWGGKFTVKAVGNDATQFAVIMEDVPKNACITLVTSTTGTGRDSGLTGVGINSPTAATISDFPVMAAKAAQDCASDKQSVSWIFRLRS